MAWPDNTQEDIEEREHALEMKAQGLDAKGNPLPEDPDARQRVLRAQGTLPYEELSQEAAGRGTWSGFKKPKDLADRLRPGVPWKFR